MERYDPNLLIYFVEKPPDREISDVIKRRLDYTPSQGLFYHINRDALNNEVMTFYGFDENGNQVPHATELISYGKRHQAIAVVSEEGKHLLRTNPGFLKTVASAQRTGKEVGEGWEGKVHWEEVNWPKIGPKTTEKVAVKYYFPCILPGHESSYDAVLYGAMTPGIDQMRVLQLLKNEQDRTGIFDGVEFVVPYLATIDITVAPLVDRSINLEKEFRKIIPNHEKIEKLHISDEDKAFILGIFVEQDNLLHKFYGEVDATKRFTTVFSNAGYNIIRGITAWLNEHKQGLINQGLLISPEEHINFEDATQKNIVISIPAMKEVFEKWKEDPSIADEWIKQTTVDLDDPLLDDPFLHLVRGTAHVIEVMVTNRVVGRIGDEDY